MLLTESGFGTRSVMFAAGRRGKAVPGMSGNLPSSRPSIMGYMRSLSM